MVEKILREFKTIAVVGLSPRPDRPSHRVASYLKEQGYKVIPIHPQAAEILGERCYPDLRSVPEPVEVVNIFRRPKDVPPVVKEAIEIRAKAIWIQEGIVNEEAAAMAQEAGLLVVMDRCILKELRRMKGDQGDLP